MARRQDARARGVRFRRAVTPGWHNPITLPNSLAGGARLPEPVISEEVRGTFRMASRAISWPGPEQPAEATFEHFLTDRNGAAERYATDFTHGATVLRGHPLLRPAPPYLLSREYSRCTTPRRSSCPLPPRVGEQTRSSTYSETDLTTGPAGVVALWGCKLIDSGSLDT